MAIVEKEFEQTTSINKDLEEELKNKNKEYENEKYWHLCYEKTEILTLWL